MTNTTVTHITASNLIDHYVLVTFDDLVISGYLTAHDATTFTVSHVDHRGVTTGTTIIPYVDVTSLVDFYADFDDVDED